MFAKVIVFGVTTFVIGFASLVLTALVTAPLLSGKGVHADFGDPQVWLRLVGGAAYLVLIGLISFGIGLIIRNSAGSIAAALGLVLVVPIILSIIAGLARAQWVTDLSAFLPSSAGGKLFAYPDAADGTNTSGIDLTTWQSLLVVLAWFAVTFVVGLVLLKRRDA
jgi:ABC-2 type transport system permease protein